MKKKQIKELAQDLILQQAAQTYYRVESDGHYTIPNQLGEEISPEDLTKLYEELRHQSDRVARLFNYDSQPYNL